MDMQMEHTPTPYHVGRTLGSFGPKQLVIVAGVGDREIGLAGVGDAGDPEHEANAAFFVRACNNHDGLVGVIKQLFGAIDDENEHDHDPEECDVCYAVDDAKWWLKCLDKEGETGANDLLLEAVELITDIRQDSDDGLLDLDMAPAYRTVLKDLRDNCQVWLDKAKGKP